MFVVNLKEVNLTFAELEEIKHVVIKFYLAFHEEKISWLSNCWVDELEIWIIYAEVNNFNWTLFFSQKTRMRLQAYDIHALIF